MFQHSHFAAEVTRAAQGQHHLSPEFGRDDHFDVTGEEQQHVLSLLALPEHDLSWSVCH
jgi:hypothetical protein